MDLAIKNTLIVKIEDKKEPFVKTHNRLLYDDRISSDAKILLLKLIAYHDNPTKHGDNWTQKRTSSYFNLTRYETKKLFDELLAAGYCYHIMIYPQEKSSDGKLNNRIQHFYYFYESPDLNPYYKQGEKVTKQEIVSNDDEVEKALRGALKDSKKKEEKTFDDRVIAREPFSNKPMQLDTENMTYEEEDKFRRYINGEKEPSKEDQILKNALMEEFKASYFMNLSENNIYKIDMPDKLRAFVNARYESGAFGFDAKDTADGLIDMCWDLTVRTITTEKTFEKYRYNEIGEQMASRYKPAFQRALNDFEVFQLGASRVTRINEKDVEAGKTLLLDFAAIISNYISLGFTANRIPKYGDYLGLLKTLADNPELICLKYNKDAYGLLHRLFKANQANYTKIT